MRLVRFKEGRHERLGIVVDENVIDISQSFKSIEELIARASQEQKSIEEILEPVVNSLARPRIIKYKELDVKPDSSKYLLIPVNPSEVWGFGRTYDEEKGRPFVFFKTTSIRCKGPNDVLYIRSDSKNTIPEPELAVVLGFNGELIGYTIGNDLTAIDIGANRLYVSYAKTFNGCCSIGPCLVTKDEIKNPYSLKVYLRVLRNSKLVFSGETSTSKMKRRIDELLYWLMKDNVLPPLTICLTGTGILPPKDFTLKHGDLVELEIEKIGVLRNYITKIQQ
jgi:2-dehydro-3-deoxy-D-arabinonate dehydratase